MKKKYAKPQIIFEDFTLSTNIATGCESIVGNPSPNACPIITSSGDKIFGLTGVCEYTSTDLGQPDDMWDGFCYHIPTERNNLFNS